MSDLPDVSEKRDNALIEKENNSFQQLKRGRRRAVKSTPQHIGQHLRQPGIITHLVQQTDKLVRLHKIMRAYLPPHLQDHARLAAADESVWLIKTESSAWATRLRYELPNLRQQLSLHLQRELPPFKLKVEPLAAAPEDKSPPRRLTLTQSSASFIEGAADSVNDERLGAALMRLAAHAQKAS